MINGAVAFCLLEDFAHQNDILLQRGLGQTLFGVEFSDEVVDRVIIDPRDVDVPQIG